MMNDVMTVPQLLIHNPAPTAMYKAAPNDDPDDIPITDGDAIGFLNKACMAIPPKDRAAPTIAAPRTRGALIFEMTRSSLHVCG